MPIFRLYLKEFFMDDDADGNNFTKYDFRKLTEEFSGLTVRNNGYAFFCCHKTSENKNNIFSRKVLKGILSWTQPCKLRLLFFA